VAAARLGPGEAVLDVGCGCGATTLAAARAVGRAGAAHGVDLSEPMLGVARRRAAASGPANVTFAQADAQAQGFPARFDAAISRFGTMFFADQVAALANVRRGLWPGGRLCLATWRGLDANEWLTVPAGALRGHADLPDVDAEAEAGGPGMFGQSDPERVTATLLAAGYENPRLDPVELVLTFGANPDEAAEYLTGSGLARVAFAAVSEDRRPAALAALRAALAEHAEAGGVRLGAAIWIVTAGGQTVR
jgi:SAM-dependent methyltransferase